MKLKPKSTGYCGLVRVLSTDFLLIFHFAHFCSFFSGEGGVRAAVSPTAAPLYFWWLVVLVLIYLVNFAAAAAAV